MYLNMKAKTIWLLEENIGEYILLYRNIENIGEYIGEYLHDLVI